jgi:hypothetical protein
MKTFQFALIVISAFLLFQPLAAQEEEFLEPKVDRFWIAISSTIIPEQSGGLTQVTEPGEDMVWLPYITPSGVEWYNIWFYDDPLDMERMKRIRMGFYVHTLNPELPGTLFYVVNWSTPAWDPPVPHYPLPPDEQYIMRSETNGPVNIPGMTPPPGFWVELMYEITDYNPEWVSVDIFGQNIIIEMAPIQPPPESPLLPWWLLSPGPGGTIVHECLSSEEYGDAPEGDTAYINPVIIGNFPTCTQVGPLNSFIVHGCPSNLFFGALVDCEGDGNAGWCPTFGPNQYNSDECGTIPYPIPPNVPPGPVDEGLITPIPYTLGLLPPAFYGYFPCGAAAEQPLGYGCSQAVWGQNVDIWLNGVNPQLASPGFFNLLVDWNQDGDWLDVVNCNQTPVPEHAVVNFLIPPGFTGPISVLNPPAFTIGSDGGKVWARFTLTESPVNLPWDGSGQFNDGETEDYLLGVNVDTEIPVANWPIILAIGLIIVTTLFLWWKRR